MSGGIGSRFWPFSRKNLPKQFLDFFGTGRSLLQQTYDRFVKIIPKENIIIVTNEIYADLILKQLPELDKSQVLLEPCRRNTAPCIAWASYHIQALDPEANIVVAPSDHLILKEGEFMEAVNRSLHFVQSSSNLVTLGIHPNRPETGYGYIQIADEKEDTFYKVKTFTEKPELELAKVFVESGEFHWNSGLFIWNVKTIIKAFEEFLPVVSRHMTLEENVYGTSYEQEYINKNFPGCPNISIDFGVMEKAENVYVQLGNFGWSDLGTWNSLHELHEKDENENAITQENTLLYDCNKNIIASNQEKKLIVAKGLENYLVADTEDVLLICPKDDEKAIRQYVIDAEQKTGEHFL
jgi:mannose-1-phosphate guanylyltransferase